MPAAVQAVVPVAVPLPPRSLIQVTWVTPTLSLAVPPRVRAWRWRCGWGSRLGW